MKQEGKGTKRNKMREGDNNNNNSDIALYPVKIYELVALTGDRGRRGGVDGEGSRRKRGRERKRMAKRGRGDQVREREGG